MSDLVLESSQSPSTYGVVPLRISDEAMEAKRKALEILVAEPERNRMPVPNHLLNSKLFVKLKRNKLIEVTPHEIHFDGFEINQIQTREIHILNRSSEVLRIDIIPPQTSFFQIDYKKPQRLVTGFSIHVKILFKPTQWQYYHDAIRIHTPERDNHIIVPIHAYPIILLDGILPNSYQFPNTPVGQVTTKTFSFQSGAPIEFQYRIEILNQDPALTIEPMEGTIEQSNVTNITVTYAPTAFCTSRLSVAIIVSQFHVQPFICTFVGKCLPGLARELAKKTLGMSGQFSTDNINLVTKKNPLAISSISTKQKTTTKQQQQTIESIVDNDIERDGLRIPKKIDSTWAVSKVLLQKKGKVALRDLRRFNELSLENQRGLNRQRKETIFLQDVNRIEDEEQRNKIRWQTKLGFDPLSQIERENILTSRHISWDEYSIRIGQPIPEDEYIRDTVSYSEQRTIRSLDMKIRTDAQFDVHTNNLWLNRLQVLDRFAQAARRIIVKQRLSNRLKALQSFIKTFKNTKTNKDINVYGYEYLKILRGETLETDGNLLIIRNSSIGTFHLPRSDEDEQDNSNTIEGISPVNAPQITFKLRYALPAMTLTVPKQYKLLNYQTTNPFVMRYDYTTFKLARSLRVGAEDELIKLDETSIPSSSSQTSEKPIIINPSIPSSLLTAPVYHPLTVFNPTPGVMTYETQLPYSAIDSDNALCPIPLLERPGYLSTNRYLDREDVIQGTMAWKNMHSTGLSTLSQVPTMSNVWLPRWNDPFSQDIIPTIVPPLLHEMPASDRKQLLDEETNEETKLILTPEMIRAEFIETHIDTTTTNEKQDAFPHGDKLPESNVSLSIHGRESRSQREQELDYFQRKKFGQLTDKVNKRIEKNLGRSQTELASLSDQQQPVLIEPSQ